MRPLRANALLVATLAALPAVAAASGCSSSSSSSGDGGASDGGSNGALAASCTLNTDCNVPLVCTYGACHQACAESRDCPAGERCIVASGGNVCELPEESSCAAGACPGGLVCAPDKECRTPCSGPTSCLTGQLCQGGACYDPAEVDGAAGD